MKRILALALSALMLMSAFSFCTFAEDEIVQATQSVQTEDNTEENDVGEDGEPADTSDSISIYITAQNGGEYLLKKTEVVLPSDYADIYGLSGEGKYSVTDALVAATALREPTLKADNISDYIEFSDSGYLTGAFGVETSSFGFTVNGIQPHDDTPVSYPGMPESYSGYSIGEAQIGDGDEIDFYFYLDDYAMDNYSWFELDGERVSTVRATVGETLSLKLVGYPIGWYGCAVNPEVFYSPLEEAIIYIDNGDGEGLVPTDMTDEEGTVGVTFTEEGVYVISALHDITDEYATPIVMPYLIVAVGENADTSDLIEKVDAPIPSPIPTPGENEVLATITAPEGATVFVGEKPGNKNYVDFTETEPSYADGGTYYYILKNKATCNYRISGVGVTVADKFTAKEGECEFTFTEESLAGDKDAVIRNDGYYEGNILLNLNAQNSVHMSVGDTKALVAMRAWQAVDTTVNNYFFEPDFEYTVHGDSVTVSEDGIITAIKDGVSFVTVTYDAIRANGHLYSAIFPENTGVFAVTVGDGYTESGIPCDSELCPIFFLKEDGSAKYSFTLTDENKGAKVTLLSPRLDEKTADYGDFAFTDDGVSVDGDEVTLALPEGRSIVKLETDDGTAYHVLTARPISVSAEISEKVDTDADEICEGDTVTVTLKGLSAPVPKLAGVYNFSNQIFFTDEYGAEVKGASAQYNFTVKGNTLRFTVPEGAFDDGAYRLDGGYIFVSGWGDPIGEGHRSINRETGKNFNFNAELRESKTGVFPAIIITPDGIKEKTPTPTLSVKTPCKTSYYVGDKFDAEGLVLEYTDVNGVVTEVREGFAVSNTETLKRSVKSVTVTYNDLSVEIAITVSAKPSTGTRNITVKVAVRGDYVHGDEEHEGSYPVWIKSTSVKVPKGSCAYDAISKVLTDRGYTEIGGSDGYISSIITSDGTELSEFSNGTMSGWMYTVNNKAPDVGMLDYELKDGDKVALFFTDDFNELWKNAWSSGSHSVTVKTDDDGKTVPDDDEKAEDDKDKDKSDGNAENTDEDEENKPSDEKKEDEKKPDDEKAEEKLPFEDVSGDAWYYGYIAEIHAKGYVSGKSETRFDPDGSIKRCEIVKILALFAGVDTEKYKGDGTFSDVPSDSWYHEFVEWASSEGIVNGVGDRAFAPEKSVTREDAAVIIYRFTKLSTDAEDNVTFADAESISEYAADAVRAVCASGIMGGFPDGTFAPKANLSRAQFCKIISEMMKLAEDK